ncbi:hypothetical protein E2C01_033483 [Portunus trituberculatus]|uniref:Uncharacterized protein n=1 Tax=Portunus trituberculatus TaxID=210409 RepID=A0A5B7EY01_PORTR|nr:hypothetical protein [Portunus trituberculatus]
MAPHTEAPRTPGAAIRKPARRWWWWWWRWRRVGTLRAASRPLALSSRVLPAVCCVLDQFTGSTPELLGAPTGPRHAEQL